MDCDLGEDDENCDCDLGKDDEDCDCDLGDDDVDCDIKIENIKGQADSRSRMIITPEVGHSRPRKHQCCPICIITYLIFFSHLLSYLLSAPEAGQGRPSRHQCCPI